MPFSVEVAAQQVQERLKLLTGLIHDIASGRKTGECNLDSISKLHDDIMQDGKMSPFTQQKLKALYLTAIDDATQEEDLLRVALGKIYEIRAICNERIFQARSGGQRETFHRGALMNMLQISAQNIPLWVGKPNSKIPPLCGAIPADPSYIAKPGDMVAALAKAVQDEENWILAEVVSFNTASKTYEVDDIDGEQKPRYTLSKRRVVPLPLMRANPETDPEALFPKGAVVIALYPQSTCFYKAVVNDLPRTSVDGYELLFENSEIPGGFEPPLTVHQRYVIGIKEKKKM